VKQQSIEVCQKPGVGNTDPKVKRGPKLYAVETIVACFSLLGLLLYFHYDIQLRSPLTLYKARIYHSICFYGAGLLVMPLLVRLGDLSQDFTHSRQQSWVRYRKSFLNLSSILHDIRLLNAIAIMFVAYINLKHLIPVVNGQFWDATLVDMERAVFGGNLASFYLHQVIDTSWSFVLSDIYKLFYLYVAFFLVFFVLQRDKVISGRYYAAFALCWFFGILMAYAFPTVGPCFQEPALFNHLPYTEVTKMQEDLWRHKLFLDAHPQDPRPVYLISGVPSLHLAVPLLNAILLWPVNKFLSIMSWIFVSLTAVTTVYFGWHYIIDDIASVLLVAIVVLIVNHLFHPGRRGVIGEHRQKA
jgi:membrane-associated phospholipid phosphatase